MDEKRITYKKLVWESISFKNLRKGDIFRIIDPKNEVANNYEIEAHSDPYDEDGVLTVTIKRIK